MASGSGSSSGAPGRSPPNVLLVVLDCVRSYDFPGGLDPVSEMPFLQRLRQRSVVFPRAVSPSPWTIPSHASLFTGLYPWEHGVHMKGELRLDAGRTTLPGLLRAEGYATFSASSNGFISPEFGLVNGFGAATWADWWEKFLRFPGLNDPPRSVDYSPLMRLPSGPLWDSLEGGARFANRLPLLLNVGSQLASRLRAPRDAFNPVVSPWVEPTIRTWLGRQPPSTPVFCFVNLYDAHEPYLAETARLQGSRAWLKDSVQRMDRTSLLAGQWVPTEEEFTRLRRLYREMIRRLDARIQRLVETFQEAGRWENTLMVVTSDHGQAFGEHGFLFHGYRLWESIVRVPLWVRYPNDEWGGKEGKGWASLIDVGPTVMEAAGSRWEGLPSAESLTGLIEGERGAPVMTMADGVHVRRVLARLCPPERVAYWDSPWMAGYEGDRKLLIDLWRPERSVYEVGRDPREERDLWGEVGSEMGPLETRLREAGRELLSRGTGEKSKSVEDRLRSWGYC